MASDKKFVPTNPTAKWVEDRLPIMGLIYSSLGAGYDAPRNLNYWWNFGVLAGFMMVVQIVTGIVLAMHYIPDITVAFRTGRLSRGCQYIPQDRHHPAWHRPGL